MPYKKILLALECVEKESSVIKEAFRLKNDFNASLTVFHVNNPSSGKTHMMMDSHPKITEEDLRGFLKKSGFERGADEIKFITEEGWNFAQSIANACKEYDLLILGHKHKGFIASSLKDSTDEKTADLAGCPILLVPMD